MSESGRVPQRPGGQHQDASMFEQRFGNRYFIVATCVVLIAVLSVLLIDRVDREMQQYEKTLFDLRLTELHAAVLLKQAALVATDQTSTAPQFEGVNPMNWLEDNTTHYLGEMRLYEAQDKPGNWVFDPQEKVIAYLPNNKSLLKSSDKWLRFKVVALFSKETFDSSSDFSRKKGFVNGLVLKEVMPIEK
mgnify:CR=1 FL=1